MNKISDKYRFSDFTISNFQKIIQLALIDYKFILYDELNHIGDQRFILLRHDIEFSVPIALKMAKIEASFGIRATYFVQLHGDFYNALEKNTFNQLKEIESLGHTLALHFDAHFWGIENEAQLEKYLKIDTKVFNNYFGKEPYVFSFHNTNAFILSCDKEKYAGILNVYSKSIKEAIGYCADSTGYWRYEILEDRLRKAVDGKLQILVHDGMWQEEVLPPRRRVYKIIEDHANYMKRSYDETLIKFGAKNIDWNGDINEKD